MSKKLIAPSALALSVSMFLAAPVLADPAVGFGLNFTFGNGNVDVGAGLRVFSDDENEKAAASAGIDYMFRSQSLRGSLGVAYLTDDKYIELNGGYNFNGGGFDMGLGGGWVDTKSPAAASATAPATGTDMGM